MKRKLNVIDYSLIIIVLVALVGGGLFIFKKLNKNSESSTIITGRQKVRLVCDAHSILPDIAEKMKVGDRLVAKKAFQKAEVVDVRVEEDFEIGAVDGKIVRVPMPEARYVTVTIEGEANRYGPYLDLGGQGLKIGEFYWIKTSSANLFGSILSIDILEEENE